MILFYTEDLTNSNPILEGEEFIHCIKVLRHKESDIINVTDGKSVFAEVKILKIKKKIAELELIQLSKKKPKKNKIVLIVAPPKNRSRWEWLLEKSVEIGVDIIQPMRCNNSERIKLNIERSQKIMRTAALQSKRILHPEIKDVLTFDKAVALYNDAPVQKFIAQYNESHDFLTKVLIKDMDRVIMIGPEGDFSIQEVAHALKNNFTPVNISNNRLRTETAAIVGLNLLTL